MLSFKFQDFSPIDMICPLFIPIIKLNSFWRFITEKFDIFFILKFSVSYCSTFATLNEKWTFLLARHEWWSLALFLAFQNIQINVQLFSDVRNLKDHIFLHFTFVQLGIKIPSQQIFFTVSNKDYIFDGFVV